MRKLLLILLAVALTAAAALAQEAAQQAPPQRPPAGKLTPARAAAPSAPGAVVAADAGYTIGPEDVLGVLFWRDQEMSGDVTVRPDGMITLPLIRDIKAGGLTPTQLADTIQKTVREYVTDASVTVVVRQMNSRKVFITGEVAKPGPYALGSSSLTVLQLIAVAGGLTEWANAEDIVVLRPESGGVVRPAGSPITFRVNYTEVTRRRNLEQNIVLKPGDTVLVPER